MHKLANLLEDEIEELAIVESLDTGKPITSAKGDITESAACLRLVNRKKIRFTD
jgi:acyl-CoA reductase-like NAD-dependent aldehyde dehydrogenase